MSDVTESAEATTSSDAPPPDPRALELTRLNHDLETARRRVNELAQAIQAGERDREAFKVRVQREREQLLDVEKGNVALTLLEAIDELDLCLSSADDSPLARGVRLIRDGLVKKAEATGIERVELVGRPYDPNLAEATDMEVTGTEADDGKVLAQVRSCYQLKGRVIRPGRVKVAKYVTPAQA
jgi:molecular chaperone GrpE